MSNLVYDILEDQIKVRLIKIFATRESKYDVSIDVDTNLNIKVVLYRMNGNLKILVKSFNEMKVLKAQRLDAPELLVFN